MMGWRRREASPGGFCPGIFVVIAVKQEHQPFAQFAFRREVKQESVQAILAQGQVKTPAMPIASTGSTVAGTHNQTAPDKPARRWAPHQQGRDGVDVRQALEQVVLEQANGLVLLSGCIGIDFGVMAANLRLIGYGVLGPQALGAKPVCGALANQSSNRLCTCWIMSVARLASSAPGLRGRTGVKYHAVARVRSAFHLNRHQVAVPLPVPAWPAAG